MVGVSFGNSDFQAGIKRRVRKGEIFWAFPTCFPHIQTDAIMGFLRQSKAASEVILLGAAGSARHAVRVKVFPYPEATAAVWVMISVCYSSGGRL